MNSENMKKMDLDYIINVANRLINKQTRCETFDQRLERKDVLKSILSIESFKFSSTTTTATEDYLFDLNVLVT